MPTNDLTRTETTTRTQGGSSEVSGVQKARERRRRARNNVRKLREDRLLSKAELARRAGVSPLTIDRIESGKPCRMDTKRKIILALGMTIEDKDQVFVPERPEPESSPEQSDQEQDEPQGS